MNRQDSSQTTTREIKTPKTKNGFFATWNGIRLADDCQEEFQCKGGEYCIDSKNFLCQQTYRYCISKSLVCDGILNCDTGDESDEKHCELTFLESRIFIMIALIGPTIFIFISIIFCIIHKINKVKLEEEKTESGHKFPMPTFIVARESENNMKTAKILVFRKNETDRLRDPSPSSDPFDSSEITDNSDNQKLSKTDASNFFPSKNTESKTRILDDVDSNYSKRACGDGLLESHLYIKKLRDEEVLSKLFSSLIENHKIIKT
ncbi:CUB domain-containing [Brachionus plicatilis]|uniref:CUB domain-containing n=1 Tax=Brachionus plicatilis TaxID=10195 RepID=A0A3M7RNL0_BRAPC|nr:CUB domain-containing [Brachionus plicatilis]